jgi:hypothetical protein
MQPLNIKLYDLARAKLHLNDTDAMDFVSSIHELQDHRFENLVTKEYLDQKLKGITEKLNQFDDRINHLDLSINDRISNVEIRLSEKIINLDTKLSETKFDILKWMFLFWAGQMSITIAIVLMFIKK